MRIKENQSLKELNSFGFDVYADLFCDCHSVNDLNEALKYARDRELPFMILGGGSNVLFVNSPKGLLIKNSIKGIKIISEDENTVLIKSGAGENWHELVLFAISKGFAGIENLSLIPGQVGAAPLQNIGAYGVELKDCFDSLEALDIETGELRIFRSEDCAFGYRESVFKRELKGKYIVCSVTLNLKKQADVNISYGAIKDTLKTMEVDEPTIKSVSDAVIHIRQSKLPDPAQIGNAGSFFKNPVLSLAQYEKLKQLYEKMPGYAQGNDRMKVPAGWLIEQAGWKGKRFDDAGVHEKQALVLVNHGKASGEEIFKLSQKIKQSILEKFGITLEEEVNIIK